MPNNSFIGQNGFYWWQGVLEDRADPLSLGRARVRIIGVHTDDKTILPTSHLPWAHGALPLDNHNAPNTPPEGTWILGFFQDGMAAQHPVMMFVLPGIPEANTDASRGFADPRTQAALQAAPRPPQAVQYGVAGSDGAGTVVTENQNPSRFPRRINEPSTSRLSRGISAGTAIELRTSSLITTVPGASPNETWNEPGTGFAARAPYNHANETESGHVMEFDDTPGAERIHMFHRTGTFIDLQQSGDKVQKVVKNNYEIIYGDDFIYIRGTKKETVDGALNVYIKGDVTMQVDGSKKETINGSYELNVIGTTTVNTNQFNLNSAITDLESTGPTTITGSVVTING